MTRAMGNRFFAASIFVTVALGSIWHAQGSGNLRDQELVPKSARLNPARVRSGDPFWKYARREVYANQPQLDNREAALTADQLEKYVLRRGNRAKKLVALTFDDGPHPNYTPQLLDILRKEQVKATFFVIGHMADRYPGLVKQIAAEGHEIGNHTYSHATLTKLSSDDIETEYKANNDVIHKLTGRRIRYCRPPGGDFNLDVLRSAAAIGLTTVLWTDDPGDYDNPGDQVLLQREVDKLSDGGIVLLHDGSKDTLDTLAAFLEDAKRKGYSFVSLDGLGSAK